MKIFSAHDIEEMDRKYRLNLINSITGIKPANLIATKSEDGRHENVAIFSSVVHLGSHPAQIGFIMRPQSNGFRDTYSNILATKSYTINHISESFIKKAHYTSAKLPKEVSEFDVMHFERAYIGDTYAPFVKESKVKVAMEFLEGIELPNGCIFIIGSVKQVILPEDSLNDLGQLELSAYEAVGVAGLNSYYRLNFLERFPYVRNNEIPDFNNE